VIARELDDPALLARALTACGFVAAYYRAEVAEPYFAEAIGLARATGDKWRLSQILAWHALSAVMAGDPIAARAAAQEGRDLADAIGDRFVSRNCRIYLGWAQIYQGDLAGVVAQFGELVAETEAAHDVISRVSSLGGQAYVLARQGDTTAARAVADAALEVAAEIGGLSAGLAYAVSALAAWAEGDVAAGQDASEAACQYMSIGRGMAAVWFPYNAQAALARGDLIVARRLADEAVTTTTGWHLVVALTSRARVATAQGEPKQAERDAYDALALATDVQAHLETPDILECLADLNRDAGSHHEAARLFGAAEAIRQRIGVVRFKIWDGGYDASVAALRNSMEDKEFESAWAEGAALSTEEAIAYAQRGRGERKRPTSGWASLTPTERDVVRLVSEGFGNKDIATRLFVSPRTVQTHLTHVYTKLGLTSRVQLAQEAARHA
jgi:DNA-binding CsgD family transcriptional regulator